MNCEDGNEEGEGASVCQEVLTGAGKAQASVSMGKVGQGKGGWRDRRLSENTITKALEA